MNVWAKVIASMRVGVDDGRALCGYVTRGAILTFWVNEPVGRVAWMHFDKCVGINAENILIDTKRTFGWEVQLDAVAKMF